MDKGLPPTAGFSALLALNVGGVTGAQCALYGVSPQLYPPANYSTGVGSAVAAGRIGSILGPIVAGYLMSHGVTANDVVLSMISTAILAGLVLLGFAAVSGKALKQPSARR